MAMCLHFRMWLKLWLRFHVRLVKTTAHNKCKFTLHCILMQWKLWVISKYVWPLTVILVLVITTHSLSRHESNTEEDKKVGGFRGNKINVMGNSLNSRWLQAAILDFVLEIYSLYCGESNTEENKQHLRL